MFCFAPDVIVHSTEIRLSLRIFIEIEITIGNALSLCNLLLFDFVYHLSNDLSVTRDKVTSMINFTVTARHKCF